MLSIKDNEQLEIAIKSTNKLLTCSNYVVVLIFLFDVSCHGGNNSLMALFKIDAEVISYNTYNLLMVVNILKFDWSIVFFTQRKS